MLRTINKITGYTLLAQDGEIGRCQDFLFDDRNWTVRYMVAKTAKWLPGRKVIISPVFLNQPDWKSRQFPIRQTKEQIEQSPHLDEHAPVSRQYELNYHRYYSLPYYWTGGNLWGAYPDPKGVVYPLPEQPASDLEDTELKEEHLRSTEEVIGYHINAIDGEVGHVEDFLVDDATWTLRYLVIDIRNWLPSRKVLVSPQWIESIHWAERKVHVDMTVDKIKSSPEFVPSKPVNRQYEIELYDYIGRPYYWQL